MTLQEAVARNMRNHWDYAPEPEAVTRCPECGQYQGEGDVLYFYTGTGECVGCWRDVEKEQILCWDAKTALQSAQWKNACFMGFCRQHDKTGG